jgi:hypothetical protein
MTFYIFQYVHVLNIDFSVWCTHTNILVQHWKFLLIFQDSWIHLKTIQLAQMSVYSYHYTTQLQYAVLTYIGSV